MHYPPTGPLLLSIPAQDRSYWVSALTGQSAIIEKLLNDNVCPCFNMPKSVLMNSHVCFAHILTLHLHKLSVSHLAMIQVHTQDTQQPGFDKLNHSHRQNDLNTKRSTRG